MTYRGGAAGFVGFHYKLENGATKNFDYVIQRLLLYEKQE